MDFHSSENGLSQIAHKTVSMRFRKIGHENRQKIKEPVGRKQKIKKKGRTNREAHRRRTRQQKKRGQLRMKRLWLENKDHTWVKIQIVANANCFTQQRSEQQQKIDTKKRN